ncbi:MAG: TetR/AcrR family transcriptional regulator [Leptospiraceae bacterium]|nr:TetR/AcrR family transcriptional regulator [Leptospiraceae bacterium]MCB1199727.1 TetR/AcrR family transcriptional regulator [Leptospiraceae bacterium]
MQHRKREDIKSANRLNIMDAALKVFADLGYAGTTIRDIIRESGLAIGTFYNYFPDKDAILDEIFSHEAKRLRLQLQKIRSQSTSPYYIIKSAYLALFETFTNHPLKLKLLTKNAGLIRTLLYEKGQLNAFIFELESDLQNIIDSGLVKPFNVKYTAWAMVGAGLEFLVQMAEDPSLDANDLADYISNLFLKGLDVQL